MKSLSRMLLSGVLVLSPLTGCVNQLQTQQNIQQKQIASHRLEDLCDTDDTKTRELNLHVYIEPHKDIWDYHEFREDIFGYVTSFFKKYNVNCNVTFHKKPLEKTFLGNNETGVEILSNDDSLTNRYIQLLGLKTKQQREKAKTKTSNQMGFAVTEKGIALVNGAWEEWRGDMSREEVIAQFPDKYEGVSIKEFKLRQNAGLIVHEALHCLGLFHPRTFNPAIVPDNRKPAPNAMSYEPLILTDDYPIGRLLIPVQRKLLHSFLAEKNTYKAFRSSDYDLEIYLRNMARDNSFVLRFDDKKGGRK